MPRRLAHFSDPRLDAQVGELIKKHKELQDMVKQQEKQLRQTLSSLGLPPHEHSVTDITDFPSEMTPIAHDHGVADITDFPETIPPTAHKNTHIEGPDALTPNDIGAAAAVYESAVEGFTPTTVVAAIDALAGVRIKDMGIDTNSYVQWENGLQVCWGEFSYKLGARNWTIGNSISFPKEFADIPGLFLGYLQSERRIIVSATSISETAFTPGAYNFDSAVTPWHMWYLAIGVWKT